MSILENFMYVPAEDDRFCVALVQPNGYSVMLFNDENNAKSYDSYADMFYELKGTDDLDERTAEFDGIVYHMTNNDKILMAMPFFPNCDWYEDRGYANDEEAFDYMGESFYIDSVIETDIPIH